MIELVNSLDDAAHLICGIDEGSKRGVARPDMRWRGTRGNVAARHREAEEACNGIVGDVPEAPRLALGPQEHLYALGGHRIGVHISAVAAKPLQRATARDEALTHGALEPHVIIDRCRELHCTPSRVTAATE